MEFRWYIGKVLDATNLIDLTPSDWTDLSGGHWNFAQNNFTHTVFALSADAIETNADIFTEGEEYYITYNAVDNSGGNQTAFIRPYAGDYSLIKYETNNNVGFGTKTHNPYFVRAGKKLRFVAGDLIQITDLLVYQWIWNTVSENEDTPQMDSENVLEIKKSDRYFSNTINSIQGCIFYGASYNAIIAQIGLNVREIPIKIECRQSRFDTWETYFIGSIYVKDIRWNLKDNTCVADIEDLGAGNVILKNLDTVVNVPYHFGWSYSPLYINYYVPVFDDVDIHNPDTGAYTDSLPLVRIDKLLECVLLEATNLKVGLTTTTLLNQAGYNQAGNATTFCGVGSQKGTTYPTLNLLWYVMVTTTLRELFENYFKMFECYSFCTTIAGISTLQCDNMPTLRTIGGLNFVGVSDIKIMPNEDNVKSIKIGFNVIDTRDVSGVIGLKAEEQDFENELDLSVNWRGGNVNDQNNAFFGAGSDPEYNRVWKMLLNDRYSIDNFIMEFEDAAGYKSIIGTNNIYNETFRPDTWLNRHANTINGTYNSEGDDRFNIYTLTNYFSVTGTNTYIYNTEFEYPISFTDIKTIISNPYAVILIDSDEIHPFTGAKVNSFFQPTEIQFYPNKSKARFRGLMQ